MIDSLMIYGYWGRNELQFGNAWMLDRLQNTERLCLLAVYHLREVVHRGGRHTGITKTGNPMCSAEALYVLSKDWLEFSTVCDPACICAEARVQSQSIVA
jgi:hypothetical protein